MTAVSNVIPIERADVAPEHVEGVSPRRIRLDFLDGIRGLTALYVVLAHIAIQIDRTGLWPAVAKLLNLTLAGHTAVSVFIVLSGYCLMLPVVRALGSSGNPDSFAGFLPYFGRRARRILPPYYASLAICLGVMAIVPGGPRSVGHWWSTMWPAFTPGVLFSHLFLVHNLSEAWVFKIDAPMWSVATEWQIYFLFPLILLPVYRRFGSTTAILCGIAIGLAPLYFFRRFEWAGPWYVGLFAMGMAAAGNYPGKTGARPAKPKIQWGGATFLFFLLLCALFEWGDRLGIYGNWKYQFLVDLISGICTAAYLVWAAQRLADEHCGGVRRRSVILRLLGSGWAVWLGAFSYSLYLTHALVLVTLEWVIARSPIGPNGRAVSFLLAGTFLALVFAYLFHLVFEKPFMRRV